MQAIVCREFGSPDALELAEVPDPVARDEEVVIDVEACAISFPDLLVVQGRYQSLPPLPFTPGTELAGVVRSVGAAVANVAVGDRVFATTLAGGLAERVAVRASNVTRIPGDVDAVHASAFMYAYGTSQHALKDRGALQPGETLLVLGAAGGVGLAAVELGREMGATVIAAASTEEKLELCRTQGATHTIDYATEDLRDRLKEITAGTGVDVVYDAVGGDFAEPALRSMAWEGRYLVIGFATGDIPRIPLNLPLLKGCSIVGVFWGQFIRLRPDAHQRNVDELVRWWADGRLHPHVSAVYPLARTSDAFTALAERRALGKIVISVGA